MAPAIPSNFVYPFGTHVCAVGVERGTSNVTIRKYFAGDDCGPLINPMLAEGQVYGGVAQGIVPGALRGSGLRRRGATGIRNPQRLHLA